jgi:heme/copper-type cytochrome/quinol oxidase subunit 2
MGLLVTSYIKAIFLFRAICRRHRRRHHHHRHHLIVIIIVIIIIFFFFFITVSFKAGIIKVVPYCISRDISVITGG